MPHWLHSKVVVWNNTWTCNVSLISPTLALHFLQITGWQDYTKSPASILAYLPSQGSALRKGVLSNPCCRVSELQPSKAKAPMLVTESGNSSRVREVQP